MVYTYTVIIQSLKEGLVTCYNMDKCRELLLSEISQSIKDKYSMIPIKVSKVVKIIKTK